MGFYIVTDSAADLPESVIKEFSLDVVPLTVTVEGEEYLDSVVLKSKDLMDKMRNGATPKTSQVSSFQYSEIFEKYAKNGDSVIYIAFSSGLSGSCNSSTIVKKDLLERYPDFDLTIIDTKSASVGFGLVVYKALLMYKSGATKQEIIEKTIENCKRIQHVFTVDDLEYLFRGGRVSRTAAIVGGLLGIKPVLDVDDDGKLRPIEKVRGRKNAIKRLAELAGKRGYDLSNQLIGICHGDDMPAVEELKNFMSLMYGCKDFFVNDIGCAIGAHSGPGTLAVFFLSPDIEDRHVSIY